MAGTSLAARIRRLTFAIFGLAAVAGLALVAFVAQTGYPVLSVAPLPLPGPALNAPATGIVIGGAEGGSGGIGFGIDLGLPGASDRDGAPDPLGASVAAGDGVLASLGSAGSTQTGLAAPTGKSGLQPGQYSEITAVTPAQEPTDPPDPALVSVPVEGSNSTSGLFVRSTVAPGIGGEGDVAKGAPVIPDEPEIPYEPEVPAEPQVPVEPEVPVEPPAEEPPVESPPAEEPPVETPPAEESAPIAEEPPAEVPVG